MSAAEEQLHQDMAEVLMHESGYRVFFHLVTLLGAGQMTASEEMQLKKNIAEQLLDEISQSHPQAYVRMCCDLRGVPYGGFNVTDDE